MIQRTELISLLLASIVLMATNTAKADGDSDALTAERNRLSGLQGSLSAQIGETQSRSSTLSVQRDQVASALNQAQGEQGQAQQTINQKTAEIQQVESAVAAAQGSLQSLQAQNEQTKQDASRADASLTQANQTLKESESRQAEERDRLQNINIERDRQANALSLLEDELKQLKASPSRPLEITPISKDVRINALVNQVGTLRGAGRSCTAIVISPEVLRAPLHCVEGLQDRLNELSFISGSGRTSAIDAIVISDQDHDAIDLKLKVSDAGFIENTASPAKDKPIRLLAFDVERGRLLLSDECSISALDILTGMILHNCPSKPGMSGGALIQEGMIVGYHIGVFANGSKLASFVTINNRRAIAALKDESIIFEYNCDSDCKNDATKFGIPYLCGKWLTKVCYKNIFEPTLFAACMTAKANDCSAREAERQLNALKNSLRSEISQLSAVVNDLQNQLGAVLVAAADIQGVVDQTTSFLLQTQKAVEDLNRNIFDIQSRILGNNELLSGIQCNIDVLQDENRKLIERQSQASSEVAEITSKIQISERSFQDIKTTVDSISQEVAQQSQKLSELKAEKVVIETTQASIQIKAIIGDVLEKSIKEPIQELEVKEKIAQLTDKSAVLSNIQIVPNKQVTQALKSLANHVERSLRDPLAETRWSASKLQEIKDHIVDHTIGTKVKCNDICQQNQALNTSEACLVRARDALSAYRLTIDQTGIKELVQIQEDIDLIRLVKVSEEIKSSIQNLSSAIIEIHLNGCESLGIEQPVAEVMQDAGEWLGVLKSMKYAKLGVMADGE